MALEKDRAVTVYFDLRESDIFSGSDDLCVVLDNDTIVDDSHPRLVKILAVLSEKLLEA